MKFLIVPLFILTFVTSAFSQNEAEVRETIKYFFLKILERPADGTAINYFTNYYFSGHSLQEVMIFIGSSDEFRDKFVTNKNPYEIITKIFNTFLNRPVDSSGSPYWRQILANEGYVRVIKGVVQSEEFDKRFPQYLTKGSPGLKKGSSGEVHKLADNQVMSICANNMIPDGWIKINDEYNPTECGNPISTTYNVIIILRYDILPIRSIISVCANSPTPKGWVIISTRWNPMGCGHPIQNVQNEKTIQRIH
jgi:hypothetical protein